MSVLNSQMIPTVAQASNSPLKGDAMMSAESERTDENLRRHHAKIWTTWTDEGETVICICGTRYVFSRKNGSSSLLKHSKKCLDTLAYYKNRNESFPFNTVDVSRHLCRKKRKFIILSICED